MSFKSFLRRALAVHLSLSLSACGLKLGEKAPEQSPVSYSGKNFSCVSEIPQHIEKYMKDELGDAEITDFVRCLQNAFSSFAQYTRGREQSNYAPDEIRNFLQKSFIRDRIISDELLHEFMVIKQTLVGGDTEHIARSELYEAISFLEDLRVEAIRLRPHIRILNPRLVEKENSPELGDKLMRANEVLRSSIQSIAGRLEKSKRVYPLTNLESFLTEFRGFVRWEDHFPEARPVEKWIQLLRAFKDITVSGRDPDVIHENEWAPLLENMANWYLAYLQYRVGVSGKPVLNGVGLQNTVFLGHRVFQLTRAAIDAQKPAPAITFEQINHMVVALHDIGWIPDYMRPSSIDQTVRALVTRVAGDVMTKPSARWAKGLERKALANLESEFDRWAAVQTNLDTRFKYETHDDLNAPPSLQSQFFLTPDVQAKIQALEGSDWEEFGKIKSLMRPLFPDQLDRVMLVPDTELSRFNLHHGFYNLSVMNILRSCVALIFRGYSEGAHTRWLWDTGIRGTEMQKFYVDFRDFGIDIGLVDKRNTNSGSRAFVEGKLFTTTSTGLNYDPQNPDAGELNFVEAMEYFAFLYSGGETAKAIYDRLAKECKKGPDDINGLPKISRACAWNRMPSMVDRFMPNMPYLRAYLGGASTAKRLAYTKILMDTAKNSSSDEGWLEKNELSTMAVVAHYAESIMTRFDRDQDGYLDNSEIELAIPIFSGFIRKIAKEKMGDDLSPDRTRAAFFYILKYGQIPESKMDKLFVLGNQVWEPSLKLDRLQLAGVFKAIIARLMEVGKKPELTAGSPLTAVSQKK